MSGAAEPDGQFVFLSEECEAGLQVDARSVTDANLGDVLDADDGPVDAAAD